MTAVAVRLAVLLAPLLVFSVANAEAQAVRSEVPSALLTARAYLSDFTHVYIPARTPRRAPPVREPPSPRRGASMIAAGAGLTLGALVGMTALGGRRFRCGDSPGYTFWPGGLAAGTGLLVTLAGWGELSKTARESRRLSRAQRIALPFEVLGFAAVGMAPMVGQRLFCESS